VCVGPLRFADKFVLVGDHNQLPPLVRNEEARVNGLQESLFKMLNDAHPQSVACLSFQYRMNEDIMLLSNTLVYNNRLKCGAENIAKSKLDVPNMSGLATLHTSSEDSCHDACWLRDILDPK
jgi:DNA replication ATP-dependent helicase Dna2